VIASLPRRSTRRLLQELLVRRASAYQSWGSSALVFAPHPDDETLGCGGTIAKKRLHGADVHVAFMTDGSGSHQPLIGADELRTLRSGEAEAACAELGVPARDLSFLEIEDGKLAEHRARALGTVRELLARLRPEEVFVPFHADIQPDHEATTSIVRDALATLGARARVFEYPIWFWHHWPWVRLGRNPRSLRAVLGATLRARHTLYRDMRCAADVRETLAVKRAALRRHRTQMERLAANAEWPILADVSQGDWLESFFSGYELFHHYTVPRAARRA
jgi:LmbE family N-acetylglucosaminyl deacetylase